jgi:hypothetical protein
MEANEPTITTQAELCAAWQTLMGSSGYAGRSLWLLLLHADGTPVRRLTEIEELPEEPEAAVLDNLMLLCEELAHCGGMRVAFLLSRPGRDGLSASDRRWAAELARAARRAGVAMHPVHRANDESVLVVAPDDLAGAA